MTTAITCTRATTLGPFLSLLILTSSRQTHASRHQLSPEKTAPVEFADAGADGSEESPEAHHNAIALGPFLTLILTLRRRRGG